MVRDSIPPTVTSCIPDTVAPVPSDQLNSELPIQQSVDQLLVVLNQPLTVMTEPEWRHDPAVSCTPSLQCTLSSEQQASIERKDTETVETTNSAASNQDRAILPTEFKKIQERTGRVFTLDGCANPNGKNALCSRYCSTEEDSSKEIFGESMSGSTHHLITYRNLFSIT